VSQGGHQIPLEHLPTRSEREGIHELHGPGALNQALLDGLPDAHVRTLLRGLGAGLPPGDSLVVKCTSWNAVRARHLLELVPDVPALFLLRPAAEADAATASTPARLPVLDASGPVPVPFFVQVPP